MMRVGRPLSHRHCILSHVCCWVEADVTNRQSAQVRGESEYYPQPPAKKVTWQTVVICVTEDESGHHQLRERSRGGWRKMLSGRSPVASAGICPYIPHPHPLHPPCPPPPSRSLVWQTGSLPGSANKWQPWGNSQGLASGELISPYAPKGSNPGSWHLQRCTQFRGSAGRLGHWGGGSSICSLWTDSAPSSHQTHTHTHRNYVVDELFSRYNMFIQTWIWNPGKWWNVYKGSQLRSISSFLIFNLRNWNNLYFPSI